MKLEYLEEFLSLARTNNYSVTAEEMFISVSTLSRHIILLEEELGVELFTRTARSVTLSKAGNLLYPYAETMVNAKEGFDRALAASADHSSPTLSIGFSRAAIKYGILDVLMRFKSANPNITFTFSECSPSHLLQMLKKDECSFVISYKYVFHNNSDYMTYPVIHDTLSVAMAKSHPLAGRESLTLAELKNEHFIVHDKTSPAHKLHSQLLQNAGITMSSFTQAESSEFIIDLVSHGFGISLVAHRRFAGKLPENVVLVPLKPDIPQTLLMTCKKHKLAPEEEAFLRYIRSTYPEST